ncbi:hypothetical protein K7432_003474 [Basidiobolus ranarum]|uniref:HPP transmembrane region domain-containing protein n=1 Tax=Basidiobolus ranarum TaxID=34480 RepID=A0ABR2W6I0_9FUNG
MLFMEITNTTHPPAAASALIILSGGPEVYKLGYLFLVTPILFGMTVMFIIALIVNNIGRRYPVYWFSEKVVEVSESESQEQSELDKYEIGLKTEVIDDIESNLWSDNQLFHHDDHSHHPTNHSNGLDCSLITDYSNFENASSNSDITLLDKEVMEKWRFKLSLVELRIVQIQNELTKTRCRYY